MQHANNSFNYDYKHMQCISYIYNIVLSTLYRIIFITTLTLNSYIILYYNTPSQVPIQIWGSAKNLDALVENPPVNR